ncbi:hypothetical protein [Pontivivens ytuae]|uniref:Uncharacterized protein n=1 Tax=Pontivivens ytuae TaxID=2789856 RepID=A0A7S9QE32_9RHOB|nr:hypothetical protein [Pontivivens ytuae]QPH55613.1 hypothetical protein I0K15_07735 [Pontivivens ytuae]
MKTWQPFRNSFKQPSFKDTCGFSAIAANRRLGKLHGGIGAKHGVTARAASNGTLDGMSRETSMHTLQTLPTTEIEQVRRTWGMRIAASKYEASSEGQVWAASTIPVLCMNGPKSGSKSG